MTSIIILRYNYDFNFFIFIFFKKKTCPWLLAVSLAVSLPCPCRVRVSEKILKYWKLHLTCRTRIFACPSHVRVRHVSDTGHANPETCPCIPDSRNIIESHKQTTTNTYTSVINELIIIRIIEQGDKQRHSTAITNLLICLNTSIYSNFSFKLLIPRSIFKGSGSFLYSSHSDMAKGVISHPAVTSRKNSNR